jgi:STE24 endopeptidase
MYFLAFASLVSGFCGSEPGTATASAAAHMAALEPDGLTVGYHFTGNLVWLAKQLIWAILPLIVLLSGLSSRMGNLGLRLGKHWSVAAGTRFLILYSALFLACLPLEYYGGFLRKQVYGLSVQSLPDWLGTLLVSYLLISLAGLTLTWIPYLLIRKCPNAWWFYSALLVLPLSLLLLSAAPVWIDPLFDEFHSLQQEEETAILKLARQAGIADAQVFEVRKSAETKTMNAYVTGLGTTKRIVLWDTLTAGLNEREVRSVVAHELGHYQLRHLEWTILLLTLLAMMVFYAIHRGAALVIKRFPDRLGFTELGNVASLPLIFLMAHLALFAASPAILSYSRFLERQADDFALQLTGDGAARAGALAKLQANNLSHPRPGPLYLLFRASHPPPAERLDRALRWGNGD